MKSKSVEVAKTPKEVEVRVDAYEAMGYKSKPYREGVLVYKTYYGHWFIHLILLVVGIAVVGPWLNILYFAWCYYRSDKTKRIYIRAGKVKAAAIDNKKPSTLRGVLSSRKKVPQIVEAEWRDT